MRARDNWFGELEAHAADLLAAVGHPGGPLSQRGTAEIAAHLGVTKDTVYDWISAKKMPAHRVGRLWKFQVSEIDEWVRSGGAAPEPRDVGGDT